MELKFTTRKFVVLLTVSFLFIFLIFFIYVEGFGTQWRYSQKNVIDVNAATQAPTSPSETISPTQPMPSESPSMPTHPVQPSPPVINPTIPTQPSQPSQPSQPIQPSQPSNPSATQPVEIPQKPSEPVNVPTTPSEQGELPGESPMENPSEIPNESTKPSPNINEPPRAITSSKYETTPLPPDVEEKRNAIKNAFLHAWKGYRTRAWGHDDLKPLSGSFSDWVPGGIGMSTIDGITTAWIMGLDDVYNEAKDYIEKHLSFNRNKLISVFETTIRALGGLISAYDLTGEKVFLDKAIDLGDRLMPAFNSKTGVPHAQINLMTGQTARCWAPGGTVLSEWSTLQLEFRRLSLLSGDPKYDRAVTRVMEVFDRHAGEDGLYPVFYDNINDRFTTRHISLGAWGDSFYEYLIKQYLLTNKTEKKYLDMYKRSLNGIFKHLVKRSEPSKLLYIEEKNSPQKRKMDHLVCFAGGMLLLGSDHTGQKQRDFEAGLEITKTCRETYKRMKSGLGPEVNLFNPTPQIEIRPNPGNYLLRPETVESFFYAWRYTHDQKYRDWGWEIFQAIEKHCKTQYGYATVHDVNSDKPRQIDEMHSFFLAETLKYLYLLFSPDNLIPLDEFVFNTEAHPFRIDTSIH